ncbi:MAG: dipeptide epimerase [Psychrilyobacter sp.]|uniref:dipeptide epimerase n=1 Tax=Psychrilyobacter sp. TaxID=2586924 RepID=UPI003C76B8FB
MIIEKIEIGKINVPLITPFKTALRTVESVEDIVIIIKTNTGHSGFGEAPPTAVITGDTHDSIIGAITLIGKQLIGKNIEDFNTLINIVHRTIIKNTSAKAAVEIALYDLFAQSMNRPLYKVLGGGPSQLKTDLTISVDSVEKMVADSLKAIEVGFDQLKIKVGKNITEDIFRIKSIYDAVGPNIKLRLDANQGWSVKESLYAIKKIEEYGIVLDFVEQPVKASDIDGMIKITSEVLSPILADESIFSPKDAIEVITRKAADIVNIKLMKTGGISNALKIINICEIYDIPCMIGCMLEAGISVTAAAHLAAAKSSIITRIDLDGPALCSENPLDGGIIMNGSKIILSNKPGLGITNITGFELIKDIK